MVGLMLSGGVFAAPSAPWSWSSSPPPGTTLVWTCFPPSWASSSPETSRLWILLSLLTLNGAAPAGEVLTVGPRPTASTPADNAATRTRRWIHMYDHPRSARLTGTPDTDRNEASNQRHAAWPPALPRCE